MGISTTLVSLFLLSSSFTAAQRTTTGFASTSSIPTSSWAALNQTLGGRLYSAQPLAAPCFPSVNGVVNTVDAGACAAVQTNWSNGFFISENFGGYMSTQWSTCMSASQQCLLDDATNTSDPVAFSNKTCYQGSVPSYYIDVASPSDVINAFEFANQTSVQLSIKNSGHDFKGRSSMRGSLSLWMRNLQNISYSPSFVPVGGNQSYRSITVGAGVSWTTAYEFADANNVTIIGGYHETVGAGGGWVVGGGHSVLSPTLGLGVDRVLEYHVVTPDGEFRIANAFNNTDLFWALRGGGGTFGVVFQTTYIVEPQLKMVVASVSFNNTAANTPGWLEVIVNNALRWGQEGWGGHIFPNNFIQVNLGLNVSEAQESLKPVTDFIQSQNGTVVIEELPSFLTFFNNYIIKAQQAVGIENILGSRLYPSANLETPEGQNATIQALLNISETAVTAWGLFVTTPLLYNFTEGATSVTPAWRSAIWHVIVGGRWEFNSTVADKQGQFELVTNTTQILRDLSPDSGAYYNEGDVHEPNFEQSFWGSNYDRLLSLKQTYDPNHLLDCWQCVGWRGANDPRYSCYL